MALADAVLERGRPGPGCGRSGGAADRGHRRLVRRDRGGAAADGAAAACREEGRLSAAGHRLHPVGKPDRIDLHARRRGWRSSTTRPAASRAKQDIEHFDQQLMLQALMAEARGLRGLGRCGWPHRPYWRWGASPKFAEISPATFRSTSVEAELIALLDAYAAREGLSGPAGARGLRWEGDYDHLARFGEWPASDPARAGAVG